MNVKSTATALFALFLSIGAYAQSQTQVYKVKPKRSPEARAAHRAEVKEKLARMTPAERRAFRQTHHRQQEERLNAMTPKQRERVLERRRQHKVQRQTGK